MKKWLMAALLVALALHAHAQEYKAKMSKNGKLNLTFTRAKVTIEGYNGDEVIIRVDNYSPKPARAEGLKSLSAMGEDNTGLGQEVKAEGEVLNITKTVSREMAMHIKVPRQAALNVLETGWQGGSINITDMEGPIEIKANTSGITVKNAAKGLVARSTSSDIEVSFAALPADQPISITSVSGEIDLALPTDAKATVKAKAMTGEIYSDFELALKKQASGEIPRIGGGGNIEGTINGGGTEMRLEAISGNVYIRKKK